MATAQRVRDALDASVAAAAQAHRHSVKRAREHRAELRRLREDMGVPPEPILPPTTDQEDTGQ